MLDIRLIRERTDDVKASLATVGVAGDEIDRVLELDARRRALIGEVESRRNERSAGSKKVGRLSAEEREGLVAEMRALGDRIAKEGLQLVYGGGNVGLMGIIADAKKLRPYVIGKDDEMVVSASEVCGVNMVIPNRNSETDIYPGERETVVVNNALEVERWQQ